MARIGPLYGNLCSLWPIYDWGLRAILDHPTLSVVPAARMTSLFGVAVA
jgi:hypothetical protein